MEKDKTNSRLSSLDGLRGLAIILVFLNHITTLPVSRLIPFDLLGWLFGDGVTGVTFLFILSGFLMASIYPEPPSKLHFLQKRYTRIFPIFLSMCLVMFIYRLVPTQSWVFFLSLLLLIAGVGHVLWIYIFKKLSTGYKKSLFIFFLCLQIIVGMIYVFWIMRQPAVVFSQQLPLFVREGMIFLVNATLTLPLGDYIPMLDGVYWTLVAEVLFYILYPILVSPLVIFLRPQSKLVKLIFFTVLTLFIAGVTVLSKKVLVMSLVQPALWQYFVMGIILAHVYKYRQSLLSKLAHIANHLRWGQVVLFFSVLYAEYRLEHLLSSDVGPWIRISFAFPLVVLVALLLDQSTYLFRFFKSRWLVFLGTISYSVYLSHALIIHLSERFQTTDIGINAIFVLVAFGVTVAISTVLYWLLEKPYFLRTGEKKENHDISPGRDHPLRLLGLIAVGYVLTVFFVYSSQYNFFSIVTPINRDSITPKIQQETISLADYHEIRSSFVAKADYLGLIAARFSHIEQPDKSEYHTLTFSLYEEGVMTPIFKNDYNLDYFNSGRTFPFGFPVITHSQGKRYTAVFSVSGSSVREPLTIDLDSFEVVYPADKRYLLRNPSEFAAFLYGKGSSFLTNPEVVTPLLLGLPFILLVGSYFFIKKK